MLCSRVPSTSDWGSECVLSMCSSERRYVLRAIGTEYGWPSCDGVITLNFPHKLINAMTFKQDRCLQERKLLSKTLSEKHDNKVCVIVEKSKHCKDQSIKIGRSRFLVDKQFTFGALLVRIRSELTNVGNKAIFVMAVDQSGKGISPVLSMTLEELYTKYKQDDGFLYLEFLTENTFG